MRTDDLVDRPVPVSIGDRTFILPRIKVRAVLALFRRFSDELREFRDSGATDVDGLLKKLDDDATADLVVNLVEPFDPVYVKANLSPEIAGQILALAGGINDLERIWSSLNFKKPAAPSGQASQSTPEKQKEIPGMLATVDIIARRYGISPREVVEWPYEMFLSIREMVEIALEAIEKQDLRRLLASKGLAPELADIPGVEYAPIAGVH